MPWFSTDPTARERENQDNLACADGNDAEVRKLNEPARASLLIGDALVCSLAAICEAAILAAARWGTPIAEVIALHGVVLVVLSGHLIARSRSARDTGTLAVALVVIASTGPVGAIGNAILAWLRVLAVRHGRAPPNRREGSADLVPEHPAAALAARIQSGRAMDPHAPTPESLETALTVGPPAERKAALSQLSSRYEAALAQALGAALASGPLPIRAPAYGILAGLLERALAQAATLTCRSVETPTEADQAVAAAKAVLLRTPFDMGASSVGDMVAMEVHALCARVLRAHPGHRCARLVGGRALVIVGKYQEAERLLGDIDRDGGDEAAELRLECLARLGRFAEFGRLRVRTVGSGS